MEPIPVQRVPRIHTEENSQVGHDDRELKERIDLTENERQIFDVLLDAIRNSNHETRLRVAGGWVRDKLLGKDSDDIDITIDDMTGQEFLEDVTVHIIKSNPDNSKNLETGKMRLYNQWIDFVQLRKEEDYDVNSRIPQKVEFATPEEAAYRRDAHLCLER